MMRALVACLAILLSLLSVNAYSQPQYDRGKGVSVHAFPQKIAAQDPKNPKWGYEVTYATYLKPEPEKPVLQTAEELLAYVKKQDAGVVANGLWIVYTHPDAYSIQEKELQQKINALFVKENIPLFTVRGSELPDGWKQISPQK